MLRENIFIVLVALLAFSLAAYIIYSVVPTLKQQLWDSKVILMLFPVNEISPQLAGEVTDFIRDK